MSVPRHSGFEAQRGIEPTDQGSIARKSRSSSAARRGLVTYISVMLSPTSRLRQFESHYQRTAYQGMTFPEALARFYRAMWHQARLLRPDLGSDWREDLAPYLAVARLLNGLPPG